ncbi:MAG: hypothetical protein ACYDEB_08285 [Dehalococcoidia bacterium]
MAYEPIVGTPLRFPAGRVGIRPGEEHRLAYQRLYQHYESVLSGLPVLRDRDFDGRVVKMTEGQLAALNEALAGLESSAGPPRGAFEAQERARTRLFKRLQFLS